MASATTSAARTRARPSGTRRSSSLRARMPPFEHEPLLTWAEQTSGRRPVTCTDRRNSRRRRARRTATSDAVRCSSACSYGARGLPGHDDVFFCNLRLPRLYRLPQLVIDDAQPWHLGDDPFVFRIEPRDAFADGGSLTKLATSVSSEAAGTCIAGVPT